MSQTPSSAASATIRNMAKLASATSRLLKRRPAHTRKSGKSGTATALRARTAKMPSNTRHQQQQQQRIPSNSSTRPCSSHRPVAAGNGQQQWREYHQPGIARQRTEELAPNALPCRACSNSNQVRTVECRMAQPRMPPTRSAQQPNGSNRDAAQNHRLAAALK